MTKNEKVMKSIFTTLLISLSLTASAQQWKADGASAKDVVPEGWTYTEAKGDLNKDGVEDLVVVAIPNDKKNMVEREDGYVYNFNTPELAIYFGQKAGGYNCWKTYDNVVPPRPDEFTMLDHSISITPRGVLKISLEQFQSAGGWGNTSSSFLYRYQGNDFYLIGEDQTTMARNTGNAETVSRNYLTHRCQRITYNEFDKSVKPKEKWSKMAKKPLKRMGE